MGNRLRKLELEKVLLADAADIVAAREKAQIIHHTKDIGAAGDEVEQTVRNVLRRKLPTSYYIGHGHIVDKQLKTSPQLDVIIADNVGAPILFQARNGTEYFPYEAVYAIGEVKSGYYKNKQDIHTFSQTLASIRSELQRERTVLDFGTGERQLTRYGNPLFSFMIFVSSNDFQIEHIGELYAASSLPELPNVVCFLDKGLILNGGTSQTGRLLRVNLTSDEHNSFYKNQPREGEDHWVFSSFDTGGKLLAANFGYLYFMLATHLHNCILTPPDLLTYLNHIFTSQTTRIIR